MATRFYKHKLLLDENMPSRTYFPSLNARFDVKHIAQDYKHAGLSDDAVYDVAQEEGRLLITYNTKDFIHLAPQSTKTGIIGVSARLSPKQIDAKLNALLRRTTRR